MRHSTFIHSLHGVTNLTHIPIYLPYRNFISLNEDMITGRRGCLFYKRIVNYSVISYNIKTIYLISNQDNVLIQ